MLLVGSCYLHCLVANSNTQVVRIKLFIYLTSVNLNLPQESNENVQKTSMENFNFDTDLKSSTDLFGFPTQMYSHS